VERDGRVVGATKRGTEKEGELGGGDGVPWFGEVGIYFLGNWGCPGPEGGESRGQGCGRCENTKMAPDIVIGRKIEEVVLLWCWRSKIPGGVGDVGLDLESGKGECDFDDADLGCSRSRMTFEDGEGVRLPPVEALPSEELGSKVRCQRDWRGGGGVFIL